MSYFRYFDYYLVDWLKKKDRKPLIIKGQRQVGKTTAVRELCKREQIDLLELNLEKYPEFDQIFATNDVETILIEIQATLNKKLTKNSLLFLDEIQMTPRGLSALRYFYEEKPDLPVVATGSLLDFAFEEVKNLSVPVGRVEYSYMWPFTFEEFLMASKEEVAMDLLVRPDLQKIGNKSHEKLMKLLKTYFFVGGMPKSISTFLITKDLSEVVLALEDILTSVFDDFGKYSKGRSLALMQKIFKSSSLQVTKKVKFVNFDSMEKAQVVKTILQQFFKARLLHPIYHSDANGIPIQAQIDEKIIKIIFCDIGLLCRMLKLESIPNQTVIEGVLAEQFIGQELVAGHHRKDRELYYWLRQKKVNNAELDYIVQKNTSILPIEVKSGHAGKLCSLHQFVHAKKLKQAFRFYQGKPSMDFIDTNIIVKSKTQKVKYQLNSYPLYDLRRWRASI